MKKYILTLAVLLLAGVGFTSCDDDFDNTTVSYPGSVSYGVFESPYTSGNDEYSVVFTKGYDGEDLLYVKRIGKAGTADSNTVYTVFVSDTVAYEDSVGMITATAASSFYGDGLNGTTRETATVYLAYQNDLKAYSLQIYSGSSIKVATNVYAGATPHVEGMWTTPDEASPYALFQLNTDGTGLGIFGDVNADVLDLAYATDGSNATLTNLADTTTAATLAFNADAQLVATTDAGSVVVDPIVDESLVPSYTFDEDHTHTGDFSYDQVFGGTDPGLTLTCQSASNSSAAIFTISHWCYDVDFNFVWNMDDNTITVPEQFTGYTHSSYGDVYVSDLNTYVGSNSQAASYYDATSATFYFNLIYYVDAGYFGYGYETFAITGEASAAIRKKMQELQARRHSNASISKRLDEKSLVLKKF